MNLRSLLQATPGRRFTWRYRHHRRKGSAWRRPLAMIGGAFLIVVGVLMFLTPGPGIVLLFAGAALIASESRHAARALDRFELAVRRVWRRWTSGRPSAPASRAPARSARSARRRSP